MFSNVNILPQNIPVYQYYFLSTLILNFIAQNCSWKPIQNYKSDYSELFLKTRTQKSTASRIFSKTIVVVAASELFVRNKADSPMCNLIFLFDELVHDNWFDEEKVCGEQAVLTWKRGCFLLSVLMLFKSEISASSEIFVTVFQLAHVSPTWKQDINISLFIYFLKPFWTLFPNSKCVKAVESFQSLGKFLHAYETKVQTLKALGLVYVTYWLVSQFCL